MSLLARNGVATSFGSRLGLDGLDLAVGPGARIGLVGANGSGKSTVLRDPRPAADVEDPLPRREARQFADSLGERAREPFDVTPDEKRR